MATEACGQRGKRRATFWAFLGVVTFGCLPLLAALAVLSVWLMYVLPRFVVALAFVGVVSLVVLGERRYLLRVMRRSWGYRLFLAGACVGLLAACVGYALQVDLTVNGGQGPLFKGLVAGMLLMLVGGVVGLVELGTLVARMYRTGRGERAA
jgi:hypothetical protein